MDRDRRRCSRPLFWALVACSLLYLLALPVAGLLALMAPMAADTGIGARTHIFFWAAATMPAALILCPAAAWLAHARRHERSAWALLALPWAWAAALLLGLGL